MAHIANIQYCAQAGQLIKRTLISSLNNLAYRRYCKLAAKYDLVVIGGGSGGLACGKEAASLGKRVAVLDFVEPSSRDTTWGLGGTCVNVGCIPKKLMHQASIVGHNLDEASAYGWSVSDVTKAAVHDWSVLLENVNNHIKSLNRGHKVALMDKDVKYLNAKGSLLDMNTVVAVNKKNEKTTIQAEKIVIATGRRPKLMNEVPGLTENSITSDDLFWMKKSPGKTLVIGGSYVALECAGFLHGLGYDTTVMLRSIPLRGFDQQMAGLVLAHLQKAGAQIVQAQTPQSAAKLSNGRVEVRWQTGSDEFDTVLVAVGREPRLGELGVRELGLEIDETSGCVVGGFDGDTEKTSISHIYVIGDLLHDGPELTPVAIKAGKLLARRMFGHSDVQMDYDMVPTTVFTPLEYSSVGLSEERAEAQFGCEAIEVYHSYYKPLEYLLPGTDYEHCYVKVICMSQSPHKIIGIHITGPNSGEVLQGFAVAMRCGMTLTDLQSTVGIHPTVAEELVKVHITKRSGLDPTVTGC